MRTLDRQQAFFDQLRSASTRILLLDYDGTLAPFSVDREHAFPYPDVPPLLSRIIDSGTRVVFISGRPAREVLLLAGVHPHPEIWGSHGRERLGSDGSYRVQELAPEYENALLQAADELRRQGLESKTELKTGSIAVHWRGADHADRANIEQQVRELWNPLLTGESPLHLLPFDGGIELRAPGATKGSAVRAILRETHANAAIAYLGDDVTDEDAFQALAGRGLTVLVAPQPRSTTAEVWLRPPHELVAFLEAWLQNTGGDR